MSQTDPSALAEIIQSVWGYSSFRPLQLEAMTCALERRDSLTVLPTGGGKSICYQAPALAMDGTAVVVSPLLALMKDQVDTLRANGAAAARLDSTLTGAEQRDTLDALNGGHLKLLYLSPERLMNPGFLDMLTRQPISFFAVDEAHCVSMWGHDFRVEYTMLGQLREKFPDVAMHGFTATATNQVRQDIARQLRLRDPETLIGSFFRPNLSYSVQRRMNPIDQIREVADRHKGESGIVYCIRRKDVEETAAALRSVGVDAQAYHAGMPGDERKAVQEAFLNDRRQVIVATIAFGMGIDKPNVRFVAHQGLPKSLENYQQESGRAGRDGLEAECLLIWSEQDARTWEFIFDKQENTPDEQRAIARSKLRSLQSFCQSVTCRHAQLLAYFDQELEQDNCAACDVCLGNLETIDNALETAQKILSCVVRLKERFGAEYTAQTLVGSKEKRILDNGHDQLSTHGLLADYSKPMVRAWIEQLVGQGALAKAGEYNTLAVTTHGWKILRGEATPKLLKPSEKAKARASKSAEISWEGVDRGLFEHLRELRLDMATEKGVPPFVIFGDSTLRELATYRPTETENMARITGVGEAKLREYGATFTREIREHCEAEGLETDLPIPGAGSRPTAAAKKQSKPKSKSPARVAAEQMFAEGMTLEQIAAAISRKPSTTATYLAEWVRDTPGVVVTPWVDDETFEAIRATHAELGGDFLRPIYDRLEEQVSYEQIKIAIAVIERDSE